jgi:hypothetical protein
VIVTVRDRGPGVHRPSCRQLTTPFFRGDAARTAATGAGLGLAIVDKAMQRMGGSLELANAPDGGLMAHVRLKRAPWPARRHPASGISSARVADRHTARASIARPSPTGPSFSAVLALTLTAVDLQAQQRGDALTHGRDVRRQPGRLGDDGRSRR